MNFTRNHQSEDENIKFQPPFYHQEGQNFLDQSYPPEMRDYNSLDSSLTYQNMSTFDPRLNSNNSNVPIERKIDGNNEIIKIKFNKKQPESIKAVKNILINEKDIKCISISFFDHTKQKVIRYKVNNQKNKSLEITPPKKISKKKNNVEKTSPEKKSNPHKNGPKIFGKAMIDYFYNQVNFTLIEKFLKVHSIPTIEITVEDMQQWIQKHRLAENFNKIQTFRDYWTINENVDDIENIKAKTFKDVCFHFLKNESARFIFSRFSGNGNKDMKLENALAYLGIIPTFIKGVLEPQNFHSFK